MKAPSHRFGFRSPGRCEVCARVLGSVAVSKEIGGFAGMFEALDQGTVKRGTRDPRIGEEVSGTVVKIGADAIFVDLGSKAEGVIEREDLLDAEGKLRVVLGDRVRAFVLAQRDGVTVLGTRLGSRGAAARPGGRGGEPTGGAALLAFQSGLPISGKVKAVNKGGVEVEVAGVSGFCPISQLDLQRIEDASVFVGQDLEFIVTKFEAGGGRPNIVLSRRALLEAERAVKAAEVIAGLQVGSAVRGKVTKLQLFGAFVDIGGVEGLLHRSELGIGRTGKVSQVLTEGQEIEAIVAKIEPSDDPRKPHRISLSLKEVAAYRESEDAKRYERPVTANLGTLADIFGKLKK